MLSSLPKAVRTAQDATVISTVVAIHLVRVTTRIVVAIPGDKMRGKCLVNARKCHHALPPESRKDSSVVPPPCCEEMAKIQRRLAVA